MKMAGAPGSEDRKKFLAMCGFAVIAALVLYFELRSSAPPPPPSAPVIATAPATSAPGSSPGVKKIGTTAAALDPTLHMQAMRRAESVVYEGTGRNIFSSAPAPIEIPKAIAAARPNQLAAQGPPPPPPGPPPPPPIDLKFCGYFVSPSGADRQVILVHGDDVVLAHAGDVVLRRYRILSVSATSIQVEDMPNSNKQVLPLAVN